MKKLCVRWRLRTTSIIFTKHESERSHPRLERDPDSDCCAMPRAALGETAGALEFGPTARPKGHDLRPPRVPKSLLGCVPEAPMASQSPDFIGAPGRIRTADPQIRSLVL
jgi:hypothetical protein